jgi:uncharacterized membrane protein YtjA (UPF0391 family)
MLIFGIGVHIGWSIAAKCCVPESKGCSTRMLLEGESHCALYMEADMFISMAITYLILAIITGVLGFGVLAGDAAWIAKDAFYIFLVAFGISFFMTGQSPNRKNT